jgi:hypothetical protein
MNDKEKQERADIPKTYQSSEPFEKGNTPERNNTLGIEESLESEAQNANTYYIYGDIYSSHNINEAFVRRDPRIFDVDSVFSGTKNNQQNNTTVLVKQQIQRLRETITRIIPTQERILILQYLHNVSIIQRSLPINPEITVVTERFLQPQEVKKKQNRYSKPFFEILNAVFPSFLSFLALATLDVTDFTSNLLKKTFKSLETLAEEASTQAKSIAESHLDELHEMETTVSIEMEISQRSEFLRRLSKIIDEINIQISRLDANFANSNLKCISV